MNICTSCGPASFRKHALDEALLVRHGQHDRLHQLLDLVVAPAHVVELICRLLVHLHRLDARVVLVGQRLED